MPITKILAICGYMHILVLTRSTLHHGFGGFQRQCTDLCEGFVKMGHKVTVLTTAHPDGEEKLEGAGYVIHFLHPSNPKEPNLVASHKGTFVRDDVEPNWSEYDSFFSGSGLRMDASVHTFGCPIAPTRKISTSSHAPQHVQQSHDISFSS